MSIQVAVISSVAPKPTSGGEVVLYRHLCADSQLKITDVSKPERSTLHQRLLSSRLHSWMNAAESLRSGYSWDASLRRSPGVLTPDVVVTVAHGDGYKCAMRVARKKGVPLVTFFHDWWPEMTELPKVIRNQEERHFRALYKASTVALCVSEQMREALGDHPGAQILYPIPEAFQRETMGTDKDKKNFNLYYSGNLYEYGPMLQQAMDVTEKHPAVRLEVRGERPNWPIEFCQQAGASGRWHHFAPRAELNTWLASADAFLVPMVFDPAMRRRMEASFPSKLVEFAQLGKPLVIWGPEYCSAVRWARRTGSALTVTEADPRSLCRVLENLAASSGEQEYLARQATLMARTDFNPIILQKQFLTALRQAVGIATQRDNPN